jgi:nucleoside-diphosphate-sugar epimerase
MVAAATASGINQQIINVGSGTETSVRELVRLVLELAGNRAEVIYNPRTSPGVSRMCADLKLAHDKLGYQTNVSLVDGLRFTLDRDPRFRGDIPTRPSG